MPKKSIKISDTSMYHSSEPITILSMNVYQFNKEYHRFLQLVANHDPHIILTMESNHDWEQAMHPLEEKYKYHQKIAIENTYGMHFYSKIKVLEMKTHYFVSEDIPSVEVILQTDDGYRFKFYGVHPPPPSPTEEETSKERDGELLCVAKKIRNEKNSTTIVVGDFNTVAWSRSSILFRKTSGLLDPRIGRGLIPTFHAKYWFLRFPIDQLYYSTDIFIDNIRTLPNIGSDHFPVYCSFHINRKITAQEEETIDLEKGELKIVNDLIAEGKSEQSDRKSVVTE